MVLRRALFSIVAATAMLFGFGVFTTALACPVTYAGSQEYYDCCGQAEPEDCVLVDCTAFCHAIAPSSAVGPSAAGQARASFSNNVRVLEAASNGPEPPPPRLRPAGKFKFFNGENDEKDDWSANRAAVHRRDGLCGRACGSACGRTRLWAPLLLTR